MNNLHEISFISQKPEIEELSEDEEEEEDIEMEPISIKLEIIPELVK